jgi:hypothetical protein
VRLGQRRIGPDNAGLIAQGVSSGKSARVTVMPGFLSVRCSLDGCKLEARQLGRIAAR